MNISKVTVEDMLLARENRVMRQETFLKETGCPLISFTLNIPGEIKYDPLTDLAFEEGLRRLYKVLPKPVKTETVKAHTGCEAIFAYDLPAEKLKAAAVVIEEEDPLARLFDMDVIDLSGEKLSRGYERKCILCGGPVAACARSRAHGLEAILEKTRHLLHGFGAKYLAEKAYSALIAEVYATPKPGLVDRANCGAHRDMDITSFEKSADAIKPCFEKMAMTAFENAAISAGELMKLLRTEGMVAEAAMLKATGGANTHKGAIFSLGIITAAAALSLEKGGTLTDNIKLLAGSDIKAHLTKAKRVLDSNGAKAYAEFGVTGAMGEAAGGFPNAFSALGKLEEYRSTGFDENESAVLSFLHIMEYLEDTNLIHRGGMAGLEFARAEAKRINALSASGRLDEAARLDSEFIRRNLSPGGCADVLAQALLLAEIKKLNGIRL